MTDDASAVADEWLLSEVGDAVTVPANVEDLFPEDVLVPVERVMETVSVLVVTLEIVPVDDAAGGGGSRYMLVHDKYAGRTRSYAHRLQIW